MSTTTRAALTALCASALTATLAASPTQAADEHYVALGDSFSAGTGTRAAVDECYRSPYGYPALLASSQQLALDYQACSGATTADVHANQLGTLTDATAYVTMTIGGNDVGFADVITECALPGWLSNCYGEIDRSRTILNGELPGRLDALYGDIRSRASQATVVVAGYPYLFNGEDCNLATFFSSGEMRELNAGTAELDTLIEAKAAGAGFTYVDVREDFLGHAVCDDPEWINGLSNPIVESYHPNRLGNEGYAVALAPALVTSPGGGDDGSTGGGGKGGGKGGGGKGQKVATADADLTATTTVRQSPSADRPARTSDLTVREQAQAVLAMDLDTATNLRRAEVAGVDTGRLTRAVAKLRSPNAAVQEAGLVELQELDAEFEARRVQN
ncbi:SGNH/GDSL hydrolase family protein [uncultured Ornithinimicrobium sp.]|uniref:SGNH/GDSL hydrolase family protein n=1 Tax=uncultured Ornithinimicrobium sp. TaxID=259307 RepID=UPI002591BB2C|nr:SGNH/GDSL hydrolase family protein [uncultured Ornithinimicrobium sp.]